jgi:hypothetical protein
VVRLAATIAIDGSSTPAVLSVEQDGILLAIDGVSDVLECSRSSAATAAFIELRQP